MGCYFRKIMHFRPLDRAAETMGIKPPNLGGKKPKFEMGMGRKRKR